MANLISYEYIDLKGHKRMYHMNCELLDIYAEIKEETEDTIIFENCSLRISTDIFLKISRELEKKLGFQFSYGIVGYDNFVKMMQQMLNTKKKLIFSDIYSDDYYSKQIEMHGETVK